MRVELPAPSRKTCGHNISLGIILGKKNEIMNYFYEVGWTS